MTYTHDTFEALISWLDSQFARIALEKGYATAETLMSAYRKQAEHAVAGGPVQTLPQVLLEQGAMAFGDIDAVMGEMFDPDLAPCSLPEAMPSTYQSVA